MRVVSLPRSFYRLARQRPEGVPLEVVDRVRWLREWGTLRGQGLSATAAAEVLGIPRAVLYRWQGRLQQGGLGGLANRSRSPHRRRQPSWSPALAEAVQRLREQYPRWGKDKLVVLLHRAGRPVSTSMVGRILKRLRERGVLSEPLVGRISARKRPRPRPYAMRKPKDYRPRQPGDLVQLDTLDVRPLPGVVLKHFTARDVVARWDVVEVHTRATATTAAGFLGRLLDRMPFPVRALQVDGGSEFQASFEEACRDRGISLFVLPPRSPKLNGHVERAQRTHTEEFYELYDGDLDLATLNAALLQWEACYNTVRPHQSLGWRTPLEYLEHCHPELVSPTPPSHM